jgi:RsiW-degrading membrane proteinase PrsW (M82 family)/ribosomal protein S27AE
MDATTVLLLVVVASVPPAVFLLWYFYRVDKWERQPLGLILGVFVGGCAVAGVVYALTFSEVASALFGLGYAHFFLVPFIAILAQPLLWCVVRFGPYNCKQFNEPVDGIVYGASAGLGFAFVQNVVLFGYVLTLPELAGGIFVDVAGINVATQVFLPSLLLTVPLQALFSAVSCYGLGVAKFKPPGQNRRLTMVAGLLVAILMQVGWSASLIWNFPVLSTAFQGPAVGPVALAIWYFDTISFAVAAWILVTGRIDAALNRSPYHPSRSAPRHTSAAVNRIIRAPNPVRSLQGRLARFCPRCGTHITRVSRFCPKCGAKPVVPADRK